MADLIKVIKDGEKNQIATAKDVGGTLSAEEEEDELFEIDLEAVNEMYSPALYWESYDVVNTAAAAATCKNSCSTLLANCLLPIVQVSSAVPSNSSGGKALMITWPPPPPSATATTSSLLVVESSLAEEFIGVLPSFHFFASQYKKKTKAA